MNASGAERLYHLLPYVYRQRDAERGEPLRALMAVMEAQLDALEADIDQLYDNWFVETCAEWVVPYIGDLLEARGLYVYSPGVFSLRPYVANTLGYRRRKGTVGVLEKLAHDVTGWPARAVEFFQNLATTQHVNHLRMQAVRTPDLRDTARLEFIGGPFEQASYTADVRSVELGEGRYNIRNVGIFLWRLQSYPVRLTTPWAAATPADGRFNLNPIGGPTALFNVAQSAGGAGARPQQADLPIRLRRRALYDELETRRNQLVAGETPAAVFFADNPVLEIEVDGKALKPEEIQICDLSGWGVAGWQPAASRTFQKPDGTSFATQVAVDPVLGRLAFLGGVAPRPVAASYAYGFSGDLGAGPYDRRRLATPPVDGQPAAVDTIANPQALDTLIRLPSAGSATIAQALAHWDQHAHPRAVIQIDDSRTYTENVALALDGGTELVLQAANGQRPAIVGDVTVSGGSGGERVALDGLLVAGQVQVRDKLGELAIAHTTLVPGWGLNGAHPELADRASVVVAPNSDTLQLNIERAIVGPLRLPEAMAALAVSDTIIDAPFGRGQATRIPGLLSGDLTTFPALSSATPTLAITIAGEGPYPLVLAPKPASLAAVRATLEAAIKAASPTALFANARVATIGNRLLILPGVPGRVTMNAPASALGDPTVTELRIDPAAASHRSVIISGELSPFPALTSPSTLDVGTASEGPYALALKPRPTTLAQTRTRLETALRAAAPSAVFSAASVGILDNRLVLVPGADDTAITFRADGADSTTVTRLKLDTGLAAVAADDAGTQAGPPATFVRVSVFGEVHVREVALASDTIFGDPLQVERRQAGCVRFSYVVDERSTTPRRYRCQPDPALKDIVDSTTQAVVRARLSPYFTSMIYGDPGFAQLSRGCAAEIHTGAEDGSEMGAFSFLKQPQRKANLRATLNDYLRFGLDAGLFYVT